MKPVTEKFRDIALDTLNDSKIQANLNALYEGFHSRRIAAGSATHNWEDLREHGRAIREHTVENLDFYIEILEQAVVANGGNFYLASDADEAANYVVELAKSKNVKTVIKSKSMLSEEMSLNSKLEQNNVEPIETDLGEYIIQLADETPFHIIAPAMHKDRSDVADLFSEKLGAAKSSDVNELAGVARSQLREKFFQADMGVTGANFVVAETGTVALVSNEGNGRMCTSMPKIHVAVTGMEKIVPTMNELSTLLRLLIRSATGQWISSYVTTINGPRSSYDEDGPEEFHLVLVDNGRSKLLSDPELREALLCVRCGACMNACPVYRKVGGHSYGWVYPGPIGAIVSPVLTDLKQAKDLPFASSLCGACHEACPVKINIPRMLLHLRRKLSEGDNDLDTQSSSVFERGFMKGFSKIAGNPLLMGFSLKFLRVILLPFSKNGRLKKLPGYLSGWTEYRTFPIPAKVSFRRLWKLKNR